ncbi:mediator of RNA polymerase II transcription subunit 8-like [Adelges cooleyi]|uniref:mediator of RNA polymerase II transcription subunit 8-like n=1 Tax=Adelges cooleyi TaxID=133065 RepID=UPI0021807AB2|nr:mediator of RNA polymerase II transcription subunit 8-like [Adelges cooleyi]
MKYLSHEKIPQLRNHTILPLMLNTERDEDLVEHKAGSLQNETALKQLTAFNKVVNYVLDLVSKSREEWKVETGAQIGINQTSSMADLHTHISGGSIDKNLKPTVQQVSPGSMMVPASGRPVTPGMGPSTPPMGLMPKQPPGVKANAKESLPYP